MPGVLRIRTQRAPTCALASAVRREFGRNAILVPRSPMPAQKLRWQHTAAGAHPT